MIVIEHLSMWISDRKMLFLFQMYGSMDQFSVN